MLIYKLFNMFYIRHRNMDSENSHILFIFENKTIKVQNKTSNINYYTEQLRIQSSWQP